MLILQVVAAGPQHGFAITQRLQQIAGDSFRRPQESVYPALHRLETDGLLAARWAADRGTRYYRLTGTGQARLKAAAGWTLLSNTVRQLVTVEQEMRTAVAIQRALLPNTHRVGAFFDAVAQTVPCRSIGGDFFDYMDLPGGSLGFALGDVSGKGASAALLGALMQGALAAQAHANDGPAATIAAVNTALVRRGIQGRFVSLFYGVLSPDGRLTYCNAGHNPPILVRAARSQAHLRLDVGGLLLGLFDGVPFAEGAATLHPDDYLVLFSDGVSEAMNAREEEFGDDRLIGCLAGAAASGAEACLRQIFDGVHRFADGAPQHDDVTAMVVAHRPSTRGTPGVPATTERRPETSPSSAATDVS